MSNAVCANYAQALFDLIDKKNAKAYKEALKDFASLLNSDADLFKLLCAYGIDKSKPISLIKEIASKMELPYLDQFLLLLYKKHRINNFKEIESCFTHLVNEFLGVKEGIIYSVSKLDNQSLKQIETTLGKKLKTDVELTNIVDSSLLGGLKVSLDGKVYDNSLKSQLENLGKSLLGGTTL